MPNRTQFSAHSSQNLNPPPPGPTAGASGGGANLVDVGALFATPAPQPTPHLGPNGQLLVNSLNMGGGGAVPAGGVADGGGGQAPPAGVVDGGPPVVDGVAVGVPAVPRIPAQDGGGPAAFPPGQNLALHQPDGRPPQNPPNIRPFGVPLDQLHPGSAYSVPLAQNQNRRPLDPLVQNLNRPPHVLRPFEGSQPAARLPLADGLPGHVPPTLLEQQAHIDDLQRLLDDQRAQYSTLADQHRQRAALELEQQRLLRQLAELRSARQNPPPPPALPQVARRLEYPPADDASIAFAGRPPSHAQTEQLPSYRPPVGEDCYYQNLGVRQQQVYADVHRQMSEAGAAPQRRPNAAVPLPQRFLSQAEVDAQTRVTHPYLNPHWNQGERVPGPPDAALDHIRRQITDLNAQLQQREDYNRSQIPSAHHSPPMSFAGRSRADRSVMNPPMNPPGGMYRDPSPLPRSLPPRRQIQMPPLRCFSGRDTTNPTDETPFTDWERKLHAELLATGTHPDDWLSTMRMFLDGPAGKLFDFLQSATPEEKPTYAEMVSSLSATYDLGATEPDARVQLSQLFWDAHKETIPEFYARIERLTKLANPLFDMALTRATARNSFMEALPNALQRQIFAKLDSIRPDVPSVHQLIEWTSRFAQNERRLRDFDTARRELRAADKSKRTAAANSAIAKAPDQPSTPVRKDQKPDTRPHTEGSKSNPPMDPAALSDARNAQFQTQSAEPSRKRGAGGRGRGVRRDMSTVRCYHCQQLGHVRPFCPSLSLPPVLPAPTDYQPVVSLLQPTDTTRSAASWGQFGQNPTFYSTVPPPNGEAFVNSASSAALSDPPGPSVPPPPDLMTFPESPLVALPEDDTTTHNSHSPAVAEFGFGTLLSETPQTPAALDPQSILAVTTLLPSQPEVVDPSPPPSSEPDPPLSIASATGDAIVSPPPTTAIVSPAKTLLPKRCTETRVLTLPVEIAGSLVSAQVDTGSPITIMGNEPFQRLLERDGRSAVFDRLRPTHQQFVDYTGNHIKLQGLLAIEVNLLGAKVTIDVYIEPQSHRDLIIGMDVLTQLGCALHLHLPTTVRWVLSAPDAAGVPSVDLFRGDRLVTSKLLAAESRYLKRERQTHAVSTLSSPSSNWTLTTTDPRLMIITPCSSQFLECTLAGDDTLSPAERGSSTWLVSELPDTLPDGVFIPDQLVTNTHGSTWIEVCNTNDFDIDVPPGELCALVTADLSLVPPSGLQVDYLFDWQASEDDWCLSHLFSDTPQIIAAIVEAPTPPFLDGLRFTSLADRHAELKKVLCVGVDNHTATAAQIADTERLLLANHDVLALTEEELGCCNLPQHAHKIDTGDTAPIALPMRRLAMTKQAGVKTKLDQMLANRVIQPSCSPWSSPIVPVFKPDGTYRVTVDYRKLNAVTKKDRYPLSRCDELIDSMGLESPRFFTTLDLVQGFHQLAIDESSREKTAFSCHLGHYEYRRLPMGLCNSPASFQRLQNEILKGTDPLKVKVYLDDVAIATHTFEDHLIQLELVLERFRRAGLRVKVKKCHFLRQSLVYLGFLIDENGLRPNPDRIADVEAFTPPTTLKEVRQFVGLCSFYRRFVPGFSTIARPLTLLTRKEQPFEWGPSQQEAFDTLKEQLMSDTILSYPQWGKPYYILCDASAQGLGAILNQKDDDGHYRPVAYASRATDRNEQKYGASELECLCLTWALQYFHYYIWGQEIFVETDHQPLTCLNSKQTLPPRLERWNSIIIPYAPKISYRKGRENEPADALSRYAVQAGTGDSPAIVGRIRNYPDPDTDLQQVDQDVRRRQRAAQDADPFWRPLIDALDPATAAQPCPESVRRLATSYRLVDGVLYFLGDDPDADPRMCVPSDERQTMIARYHEYRGVGAHLATDKLYAAIAVGHYWPQMRSHIAQYCNECLVCLAHKGGQRRIRPPLAPITCESQPFAQVQIDVMKLPKTKKGNGKVLTIVDSFTGFLIVIPLKDESMPTIARKLHKHLYTRYSAPKRLISDNGTNFTSNLIRELNNLYGVDHHFTNTFTPHSNGKTERANSSVRSMLARMRQTHPHDWDDLLPDVVWAYNITPTTTTGFSPYFLVFGCHPAIVSDSIFDRQTIGHAVSDLPDYMSQLERRLADAHLLAAGFKQKKQRQQKVQYDKRAKRTTLRLGEHVMVYRPNLQKDKLKPKYDGPYEIVWLSDSYAKVRRLSDDAIESHNLDKLSRCPSAVQPPTTVGKQLIQRKRPLTSRVLDSADPLSPILPPAVPSVSTSLAVSPATSAASLTATPLSSLPSSVPSTLPSVPPPVVDSPTHPYNLRSSSRPRPGKNLLPIGCILGGPRCEYCVDSVSVSHILVIRASSIPKVKSEIACTPDASLEMDEKSGGLPSTSTGAPPLAPPSQLSADTRDASAERDVKSDEQMDTHDPGPSAGTQPLASGLVSDDRALSETEILGEDSSASPPDPTRLTAQQVQRILVDDSDDEYLCDDMDSDEYAEYMADMQAEDEAEEQAAAGPSRRRRKGPKTDAQRQSRARRDAQKRYEQEAAAAAALAEGKPDPRIAADTADLQRTDPVQMAENLAAALTRRLGEAASAEIPVLHPDQVASEPMSTGDGTFEQARQATIDSVSAFRDDIYHTLLDSGAITDDQFAALFPSPLHPDLTDDQLIAVGLTPVPSSTDEVVDTQYAFPSPPQLAPLTPAARVELTGLAASLRPDADDPSSDPPPLTTPNVTALSYSQCLESANPDILQDQFHKTFNHPDYPLYHYIANDVTFLAGKRATISSVDFGRQLLHDDSPAASVSTRTLPQLPLPSDAIVTHCLPTTGPLAGPSTITELHRLRNNPLYSAQIEAQIPSDITRSDIPDVEMIDDDLSAEMAAYTAFETWSHDSLKKSATNVVRRECPKDLSIEEALQHQSIVKTFISPSSSSATAAARAAIALHPIDQQAVAQADHALNSLHTRVCRIAEEPSSVNPVPFGSALSASTDEDLPDDGPMDAITDEYPAHMSAQDLYTTRDDRFHRTATLFPPLSRKAASDDAMAVDDSFPPTSSASESQPTVASSVPQTTETPATDTTVTTSTDATTTDVTSNTDVAMPESAPVVPLTSETTAAPTSAPLAPTALSSADSGSAPSLDDVLAEYYDEMMRLGAHSYTKYDELNAASKELVRRMMMHYDKQIHPLMTDPDQLSELERQRVAKRFVDDTFVTLLALMTSSESQLLYDIPAIRDRYFRMLLRKNFLTDQARCLLFDPVTMIIPRHITDQSAQVVHNRAWQLASAQADKLRESLPSRPQSGDDVTCRAHSYDEAGIMLATHFCSSYATDGLIRYAFDANSLVIGLAWLQSHPNLTGTVTNPGHRFYGFDLENCNTSRPYNQWGPGCRRLLNLIPANRTARGPFTVLLSLSSLFGQTLLIDLRWLAHHQDQETLSPPTLLDPLRKFLKEPWHHFVVFDAEAENIAWRNTFGESLKLDAQFIDLRRYAFSQFLKCNNLLAVDVPSSPGLGLARTLYAVTADFPASMAKKSHLQTKPPGVREHPGNKFFHWPRILLGRTVDLRYAAKDSSLNLTLLARVALVDYYTLPQRFSGTITSWTPYSHFVLWLKEVCATNPLSFHAAIRSEIPTTAVTPLLTEFQTRMMNKLAGKLYADLVKIEERRDSPASCLRIALPPLASVMSDPDGNRERLVEPNPLTCRQWLVKHHLVPVPARFEWARQPILNTFQIAWQFMNHDLASNHNDVRGLTGFSALTVLFETFDRSWRNRFSRPLTTPNLTPQIEYEHLAAALRTHAFSSTRATALIATVDLVKLMRSVPQAQQIHPRFISLVVQGLTRLCSRAERMVISDTLKQHFVRDTTKRLADVPGGPHTAYVKPLGVLSDATYHKLQQLTTGQPLRPRNTRPKQQAAQARLSSAEFRHPHDPPPVSTLRPVRSRQPSTSSERSQSAHDSDQPQSSRSAKRSYTPQSTHRSLAWRDSRHVDNPRYVSTTSPSTIDRLRPKVVAKEGPPSQARSSSKAPPASRRRSPSPAPSRRFPSKTTDPQRSSRSRPDTRGFNLARTPTAPQRPKPVPLMSLNLTGMPPPMALASSSTSDQSAPPVEVVTRDATPLVKVLPTGHGRGLLTRFPPSASDPSSSNFVPLGSGSGRGAQMRFSAPTPLSGDVAMASLPPLATTTAVPMDISTIPLPPGPSSAVDAPPGPPATPYSPTSLSTSSEALSRPPSLSANAADDRSCTYSVRLLALSLRSNLNLAPSADYPLCRPARPTREPSFSDANGAPTFKGRDLLPPTVMSQILPFDYLPPTEGTTPLNDLTRAAHYHLKYDYYLLPVHAFLQLNAQRFYQLRTLKEELSAMPGYDESTLFKTYRANLNARLRYNFDVGKTVFRLAQTAQQNDPTGKQFRKLAKFIRQGFFETDYGPVNRAPNTGGKQLNHSNIVPFLYLERRREFILWLTSGNDVKPTDFVPEKFVY